MSGGDLWAWEELEQLRAMASTHTARQIAAVLRRTTGGVCSAAQRHKIKLTFGLNKEWTEKEAACARRMHARGHTASVIAWEVNKSRNAVLGWLHRQGLLGHGPGGRKSTRLKRRKRSGPQTQASPSSTGASHPPVTPVLPPLNVPPPEGHLGIPLLELRPNHCRMPHGNGPYTFCGAERIPGSSYCAGHHCVTHRETPGISYDRRWDEEKPKEG